MAVPHSAKWTQILEGAARVVMAQGYSAASMNSIAAEAGVSKGTLYNYFPTKEALFAALIEARCREVSEQSFDLPRRDLPPEDVLFQLGAGFLRSVLHRDAMDIYRVLLAETRRFPELGQAFEAAGPARGLESLAAFLEGLDRAGTLRIPDPHLAARQFIALCDPGLSRQAHLLGVRPTEQQIETTILSAVRFFMRGYAP